jgi:integrase
MDALMTEWSNAFWVKCYRPIFSLSKHLGHSSLDVTSNVYGHLEKATRRREAEAMAGVFGI